ncbi:MAG: hypothetical protein K0B37_03065 [Bacteroidales bacterium]|nr:hypothetical protein [Bacteroidales bacterium]
MIKKISSGIGILFLAIFFISCGPSSEEKRQQEIEDSIQLEKDRRELLERAGRLFETPSDTLSETADGDSI